MGKYLVLGASPNPVRHSNKAVKSLIRHNMEVVPIGFRKGKVSGIAILTGQPEIEGVETILLYVGAKRQKDFYDYIINLRPKKLVFNPGTENNELKDLAENNNIKTIDGCALVMISAGQL